MFHVVSKLATAALRDATELVCEKAVILKPGGMLTHDREAVLVPLWMSEAANVVKCKGMQTANNFLIFTKVSPKYLYWAMLGQPGLVLHVCSKV